MKKKTKDRMGFYTVEQLGKTREVTPEGFLLCRDVPIARTGMQLYSSDEVPIEDTGNGEVRVERTPEEVFRDETIASFEGKPVTVEHPNDFVTPENWNQLSVGVVQNVRRGDGIKDDLLLADLLITSADAIAYVNESLPEVSCGYEADYEQTEPGRALQRNIVGNHVALVERGRAGLRCAIQDHEKEPPMKTKDAPSLLARLMKAIKLGDSEEIEKAMKDAEEETPEQKAAREAEEKKKAQDEAAKNLEARIAKIEAILAKLVSVEEEEHNENFDENTQGQGEEGKKEQTGDDILEAETAGSNPEAVGKVLSGDSLKTLVSRAEILSPGIAIPSGDAIKSKGAAPALMRKALDRAMTTEDGKACVEPFLMGRDIKKLTGDALLGVFNGSAELMRARNNDKGRCSGVSVKDFGKASSVADINARNRDFWANRTAR